MKIIRKLIDGLRLRYFNTEISEVKKEFIKINEKLWNKNKSEEKLLVITQCSYPASIMEFLPIVKNLEDTLNLEIIVALPGVKKSNINNAKIFESYGIKSFVFLSKIKFLTLIKSIYESIKIFCIVKNGDELLKLNNEGINIGEIIYDTIIRDTKNSITINKIKTNHYKYILKAVYMNLIFKDILKNNAIKTAFIVEEIGYIPYGIFLRQLSINKKIKTYMQTHNRGVFRKISTSRESITIKINKDYTEKRIMNSPQIVELAEKHINTRIMGTSQSLLVKGYYKDKKRYNRLDLAKIFKIDLNKKNVVLAVHCFRDAAHYSEGSIYKDYFVWMIETIKILIQNNNVNIFVKEHPASSFYKEEGIIADALKEIDNERVHFLPLDFNTASIIDCMDYVVTACGTMALEMSCFGIPGITTSKGYYYGFEIDLNVENIEEYRKILLNIQNIHRLSIDKQTKAKKIMYLISEDRLKINWLPPGLFYDDMEYLLNNEKQWEYMLGKIKEGNNIDWIKNEFKLFFHEEYFSVERIKEN